MHKGKKPDKKNHFGKHSSTQSELQRQANAHLDALKKRAQDGQPDAQNDLAALLIEGSKGVQPDPKTALHWFKAAAEQGYAMAIGNLGYVYLFGLAGNGTPEQGVTLLQEAIQKNDTQSLCHLAYAYMFGIGVTKNESEAATLYHRAMERGDIHATTALSDMYRNGTGVKKDDIKAVKLAQKGADANYPLAMLILANMYEQGRGGLPTDLTIAETWYQRAASLGLPGAQQRLGYIAETGGGIRSPNLPEAIRWYELAAAGNDPAATRRLGEMRYYGIGTSKNITKGAATLMRAAELNDIEAMLAAANLTATGSGRVGLNLTNAAAWLEKAAVAGNHMAQFLLGEAYESGFGVTKNDSLAKDWFRKSAAAGNAAAAHALQNPPAPMPQNSLNSLKTKNRELLFKARNGDPQSAAEIGRLYTTGQEGFPLSPAIGARWTALAAASGNSNATIALAKHLAFEQSPPKRDLSKACHILLPLAEQGNIAAQLMLSDIHFMKGEKNHKSRLASLHWLETAATNSGDPATMFQIGDAYFQIGLSGFMMWSLDQSRERKKSSLILFIVFQRVIHKIRPRRSKERYFEKALFWLRKAADKGNPAAIRSLGDYSFQGFAGVPQDDIAAFKLYQQAEACGDTKARVNVGIMLLEGWGCSRNEKAGISMLKKVSNLSVAQLILQIYSEDKVSFTLESITKTGGVRGYHPPFLRATRPIILSTIHSILVLLIVVMLIILFAIRGVPLLWRGLKAL